MITGITSDAELAGEVVAPSGTASLLTIDSFSELAVHYLRLDSPTDVAINLIMPGPSVIAPNGWILRSRRTARPPSTTQLGPKARPSRAMPWPGSNRPQPDDRFGRVPKATPADVHSYEDLVMSITTEVG